MHFFTNLRLEDGNYHKIVVYIRLISYVPIVYFWHLYSSLRKQKFLTLNPLFCFMLGTRSSVFFSKQSNSTGQRRLRWQPEFTHGKSAQCEFCSPTDFGNKSMENKALSVQLSSVGSWSVLRFYKVAPQGTQRAVFQNKLWGHGPVPANSNNWAIVLWWSTCALAHVCGSYIGGMGGKRQRYCHQVKLGGHFKALAEGGGNQEHASWRWNLCSSVLNDFCCLLLGSDGLLL